MKLRIKGNSLRLRLSQSEVARIGKGESVSEAIDFGAGARLTYALETAPNVKEIAAHFTGERITVALPVERAREWVNTDLVGLRAEQSLDAEGDAGGESSPKLTLLIEKDFVCIDGEPTEDQADSFPNPNLKC